MSDPAEVLYRAARPVSRVAGEAIRLVQDRFTAWNRGDVGALRALVHLPHVSVAGTRLSVREREPALHGAAIARWDHSRIDCLDVGQWSAEKAHCVATFGRYAADGRRYADGQAAYVVTCRGGTWGIQLDTGSLRPAGAVIDDGDGAVAAATAVLRRWLAAQDRADHPALRALVHLPLVELRGAALHMLRSAVALRRDAASRLAARDWWRSELRTVAVRERSAGKVTLEVEIVRLSRGGSPLRRDAALTILARLHGRWGVQVHSAL